MGLSGAVTLLALPAMIRVAERLLLGPSVRPVAASCNCGLCLVVSAAMVVLVSLNLHEYWNLGWTRLGLISMIVVPLLGLVCGIMSRRRACKGIESKATESKEQVKDGS
jgi:hypothetical protein